MSSTRPIGVFDSGLGGLSVWREIAHRLPNESIIYYGDGKNCPYGDRPREQVVEFVECAVRYFLERDCKLIVLACNAATSLTIKHLRAKYKKMSFVGMEPAVKPAALHSQSGVIGILATQATLGGDLFKDTSARFSGSVTILSHVGDGFVELVENGEESTQKAVDTVRRSMEEMIEQGADYIVLGCTHYPFLVDAMREVIGNRKVEIVDPAPAIAARVEALLMESDQLADNTHKADYKFFTLGNEEYLDFLIKKAYTYI